MPAMPEGVEEGIVRGLYRYQRSPVAGQSGAKPAQILASGTAMLAALDAQQVLADEYGVAADVWSATSYKMLREEALSAERWNRLHPTDAARTPYVTEQLADSEGPVVAVSDFMKAVPDQVARFVPGRSLPRHRRLRLLRHARRAAAPLRGRRRHIVVAVLEGLAQTGRSRPRWCGKPSRASTSTPTRADPRRS